MTKTIYASPQSEFFEVKLERNTLVSSPTANLDLGTKDQNGFFWDED